MHKSPTSLLAIYMISFRTRNHRLPFEIGYWERIPINERLCQTCNRIGNELQYLFECIIYDRERKKYLKCYNVYILSYGITITIPVLKITKINV